MLMKNLATYLDDFINEEDGYFESCKSKISCGRIGEKDLIKANRKASREEEIEKHGKPINHNNVFKSKKTYTRKDKHKNKF